MNFRQFIHHEATANFATKDFHSLRKGNAVYLNEKGQLIVGYPKEEGFGSRKPYITIYPNSKYLDAQYLHPQSKLFRDIIMGLKPKFPDIGTWEVRVYNYSHPQTGNDKYHRDVDYWMKQPEAEFNTGKIPSILYHGTSTNLWYGGIKKDGLLPRLYNRLGAGGTYGSQGDSLSQANTIYLTAHPDASARLASQQAATKHGGVPLIIKIDTKGLFSDKFTGDEDSRMDASGSLKFMGSIGYKGRIPASLLTPFLIAHRNDSKSRIRYEWTPFKDVSVSEHPILTRLKERPASFNHYDTPYYWALLDAGIVEEVDRPRTENGFSGGTETALRKNITNDELLHLIKNSPWVQNADRIIKDMHEGGMKGIKSIKYYLRPENIETPLQKKVIDMLLESGIIRLDHDYYDYPWKIEKPAIALAKLMQKDRMDYRDLIKVIDSIKRD